jgi:hypothetical protein
MQSQSFHNQRISAFNLSERQNLLLGDIESRIDKPPVYFQANFEGYMDMYGDLNTVAEYLNAHENWFCHCARPMQVEPLGNNGYTLTIGKFGSFGYEVEPKIGVILHPPVDRVYLMNTVPLPNYQPQGYEVNYQAAMELEEMVANKKDLGKQFANISETIVRVKWNLNLKVKVEFPRFIYKLPLSLIQSTGDRVLGQIVHQVSPRLTYKVQQDFHQTFDLPIPPKSARKCERIINLNPQFI